MSDTMKADRAVLPPHVGEVEALAGAWINTQAKPQGLARVVITPRQEPGAAWSLRVQPAESLEPWPELDVFPHVAPHGQAGFHARARLEGIDVELIANFKLGVLVILSHTSFHDGSGRAGYMLREFFQQEQRPAFSPAPVDLLPVDLRPFEGVWQPAVERDGFVARIEVTRTSPGWQMSTWLGDGRALGPTPLRTYRDNMAYLSFKGHYDLDGGTCIMAANTQKELIVMTSFHRLGRGIDEGNRAYRELLVRA